MIRLSVLVPTYERPGLLRSCLASLAAQDATADEFEVVVVDDGSGPEVQREVDRARATMPNLVGVRLAQNRGPAAARNRAVTESSGQVVLFLDDDVVATPSLVRRHIEHHDAGDELLAVLGRVAWHPDLRVTPFMRWLDRSGLQFAYETWLREGPVVPPYGAFYTANLSMTRALFERGGGFDERFPYAAYEDMELAWRLAGAGLHLDYRPDALGYHRRGITLADFRDRMARVGESAALLAAAQPDFPLDDDAPLAGLTSERRRAALAVLARVAPWTAWRQQHYRAEVAAAYLRGRRGRDPRREVRST